MDAVDIYSFRDVCLDLDTWTTLIRNVTPCYRCVTEFNKSSAVGICGFY